MTALGSGPPDRTACAAAGALCTVVEHPAATSAAAKLAAAITAIIFFCRLFFIAFSSRFFAFAVSTSFVNQCYELL